MFAARLFALSLLSAIWSGSSFAVAQAIPPMTATDLNGKSIRIPEDLSGDPALLFVAFEEEQQQDIDRVLPFIETAKSAEPDLRVWEVPVIDDPGSVGRFAIETGMKAGIPNEAMRARVISLYVKDRKAWIKQLGLGDEEIVYLVALGADGRVAASKPAQEITTQEQMNAFMKSLRLK